MVISLSAAAMTGSVFTLLIPPPLFPEDTSIGKLLSDLDEEIRLAALLVIGKF